MSQQKSTNIDSILKQTRLPVICAPMLRVSGIELVMAACKSGVIGAFPTPNARDDAELQEWLRLLRDEKKQAQAENRMFSPYCPNLIMRRDPAHLEKAVELFIQYEAELVITSVGSPKPVLPQLKQAGITVFSDIASIKHAHKALEAGADGLVLLSAGAGGKTGWANPFAFVRAVRRFFDGPIILSGGLSDGTSLYAALALGCNLGCMGTRFIATQESLASQAYKEMLIRSSMDDVILTRAITGDPSSWLRESLLQAGLSPEDWSENVTAEEARRKYGFSPGVQRPARWKDIWSAGHSVSGVSDVPTVAELVDRLESEFIKASRSHR